MRLLLTSEEGLRGGDTFLSQSNGGLIAPLRVVDFGLTTLNGTVVQTATLLFILVVHANIRPNQGVDISFRGAERLLSGLTGLQIGR